MGDRPFDKAVVVEGISKRFGEFLAVDTIDFTVDHGETFGFLGPNGAGKTTLIRMLTTLLSPTSGDAQIGGCSVVKEPAAVRRVIGVVPQAMSSDLDLTGYENMDIYGRFYGIPTRERRQRIAHLLETVGLSGRAHDLVASYSGGMRRRLEIARVLIHQPQILFLDEPTIGLDPQSRRVIWEFLQEFKAKATMTIFLTTHYMDEAEEYCQRVAIIDHGKIVVLGTPEQLKAQLPGSDVISLRLKSNPEEVLTGVRGLPFVRKAQFDEDQIQVMVDNGGENLLPLLETVKMMGGVVLAIAIHEQTLEDVFIHHTGKALRDEVKKVNFFAGAGLPRLSGR